MLMSSTSNLAGRIATDLTLRVLIEFPLESIEFPLEPEYEFDKFAIAVEKCNVVAGHLSKGKTGGFAKTISFFFCGTNGNSNKNEVTRKRVKLGY